MQKNKSENDEKIFYDYNIYRIPFEKADEFQTYLLGKQFCKINIKDSSINTDSKVSFTLLYCDKPNNKGSHWVNLLSTFAEKALTQNIRVYGATLICKGTDFCFAISYGNAHFYISRFCDYNFGIAVAERLINLDSVKSQQNVSHGTKLNKMHIDYLSNTTLTYGGGEIPTYVKGKSINEEQWGLTINCGTSAQFKWEETPLNIGKKLLELHKAIMSDSKIKLPRLTPLDDERDSERIEQLYLRLAKAIKDYDESLSASFSVPSFYLLGTKILQTDFSKYKLSCNKVKEYTGEIDIASLKDFLDENGVDIATRIRKISISVEYSTGQWTPREPITKYLDYVTDDNFCLRNGKWCSFNLAYVERVLQDVQLVNFSNNVGEPPLVFDKKILIQYAKDNNFYVKNDKQPYETYLNKLLETVLSATCQHPSTQQFDSRYSYRFEPCDLFTDDTLYFVKIGKPNDFAIAISQATLTLEKLKASNNKVIVKDNKEIKPSKFVLILVFDNRKTIVSKWADIKSYNFLVHLSNLRTELNLLGASLKVEFIYPFEQVEDK